jgi:hypothetical protein
VDGDVGPGRSDDDVAVNATWRICIGRFSGGTSRVPSASRNSRTVPSWWPLTMTGVPSGSAPHRHRHHPAVVAGENLMAVARRP